MKKFFVNAKDSDKEDALAEDMQELGFEYSEEDPDFIVSYGGDGTFLHTEREWPGVPKLLVRDSRVCFKCHDEPVREVLKMIRDGDDRVIEQMKLRARYEGKELLASNDVVMRNKDPRRALRFEVFVDGEDRTGLLIGDGVVISTPFGATGYYYSITRESFEEGIGIAPNNTTQEAEAMVVGEDSEIRVELVRGTAQVTADNHPEIWEVEEGESFTVRKSDEVVRILTHNGS